MKNNSSLELSLHDFNSDNPTPRIPVVICLDTSSSMNQKSIDDLTNAINLFYKAIYENDDSRYSAEVCIVSYAEDINIESGFKLVSEGYKINLSIGKKPSMGPAILKSIDLLEERKKIYKKSGIPYYQPWLVIMTNGSFQESDTSAIELSLAKCNKFETEGKLIIFPIGVGENVNYQLLNKFSTRHRAFKINNTKYQIFFEWLSKSIGVISSSQTGDTINIPTATISTWGEV